MAEQRPVPHVERGVVHEQPNGLAVRDVDEGLPLFGVAVTALGVGQRNALEESVQVGTGLRVRLTLVKVSAQPNVPIRKGEDGFCDGEQLRSSSRSVMAQGSTENVPGRIMAPPAAPRGPGRACRRRALALRPRSPRGRSRRPTEAAVSTDLDSRLGVLEDPRGCRRDGESLGCGQKLAMHAVRRQPHGHRDVAGRSAEEYPEITFDAKRVEAINRYEFVCRPRPMSDRPDATALVSQR